MLHLTLVTVTNPLHLLDAVVLNSVHLLRVVLPQSFELLALVLFDVIEHLINLLRSWRHSHASATQAPFDATAPAKRFGKMLGEIGEKEWRMRRNRQVEYRSRLTFRRVVRSVFKVDELSVTRTLLIDHIIRRVIIFDTIMKCEMYA